MLDDIEYIKSLEVSLEERVIAANTLSDYYHNKIVDDTPSTITLSQEHIQTVIDVMKLDDMGKIMDGYRLSTEAISESPILASTISNEGLVVIFKKLYASIKLIFKKIINAVKKLLSKIMVYFNRAGKRAKSLKKTLTKSKNNKPGYNKLVTSESKNVNKYFAAYIIDKNIDSLTTKDVIELIDGFETMTTDGMEFALELIDTRYKLMMDKNTEYSAANVYNTVISKIDSNKLTDYVNKFDYSTDSKVKDIVVPIFYKNNSITAISVTMPDTETSDEDGYNEAISNIEFKGIKLTTDMDTTDDKCTIQVPSKPDVLELLDKVISSGSGLHKFANNRYKEIVDLDKLMDKVAHREDGYDIINKLKSNVVNNSRVLATSVIIDSIFAYMSSLNNALYLGNNLVKAYTDDRAAQILNSPEFRLSNTQPLPGLGV